METPTPLETMIVHHPTAAATNPMIQTTISSSNNKWTRRLHRPRDQQVPRGHHPRDGQPPPPPVLQLSSRTIRKSTVSSNRTPTTQATTVEARLVVQATMIATTVATHKTSKTNNNNRRNWPAATIRRPLLQPLRPQSPQPLVHQFQVSRVRVATSVYVPHNRLPPRDDQFRWLLLNSKLANKLLPSNNN